MALVELAKFYNSFEAGVVRGRLDAEGIESVMFDTGMTLAGVGFAIPVRLMVEEEDLAEAERILNLPPET